MPSTGRSRAAAVAAVAALAGAAIGSGGTYLATSSGDGAGAGDGVTTPADPTTAADPTAARNVILLVGDGMGAAHREAARLDQEGLDGRLAMDELPVGGTHSTHPDEPESVVTDSAAGASAWATGQKTENGSISVDPDGEPLTPLGVAAGEAGLATGLVTTSEVTDATGAAFFASVENRDRQTAIARQYLEAEPEVVLGGGRVQWRGDGDLVADAEDQGYRYVTDGAELASAVADGGPVLGLFADEQMYESAPEGEGATYDPAVSLPDMARAALDVVARDDDGFLLVIEEEGVDSFSHDNNATGVLEAMRALDETVEVVRDFAAENPDTLVVVTGDHESGGLAVEAVDGDDPGYAIEGSDRRFDVDWTTDEHTAEPVPLTAAGPGSARLAGFYPNTHLYDVMHEALLG